MSSFRCASSRKRHEQRKLQKRHSIFGNCISSDQVITTHTDTHTSFLIEFIIKYEKNERKNKNN
jgi:hypothetical protein